MSPVRRVLRNPLALVTALATLLLAMFASGLGFAAQARLGAELDRSFRGGYDILVRPSADTFAAAQTQGLIEPNFLSFAAGGGISLAKLAAVRAIPGVELAAPVATIGFLDQDLQAPVLVLDEAAVPSQVALSDITVRASTTDGVHEFPMRQWQLQLATEPVAFQDAVNDAAAGVTHFYAAGQFGGSSLGEDGLRLVLSPPLPAVRGPILAVDPIAEQALVGGTGLDGLLALADLPARSGVGGVDLDPEQVPEEFFAAYEEVLAQSELPATEEGRPIFPVVVSASMYAPLTMSVQVSQRMMTDSDLPDAADPFDLIQALEADPALGDPVLSGPAVTDLSGRLVPYQQLDLSLPWPGSPPPGPGPGGVQFADRAQVLTADRPVYGVDPSPIDPALPAFVVSAQGPVGSDGLGVVNPADPAQQSYRVLTDLPAATDGTALPAPVIAPLGTFNLDDVDLPTNPLNYVPLGAYTPPTSVLVADPDGAPASGELRPTLNPVGFLDVPPLALTDLQTAVELKGPTPIDAIRIKVAGLTGYDAQSRQRLETVAGRLADLGLRVDVVAGASPREVSVYVPDYLPVDGEDEFTDLGWVSQRWTSLGAAVEVSQGFSAADRLLLGLAVGSALLFAVGQQVTQLAVRTREVRLLRGLGWRRRSIATWQLSEGLVVGAVILVAATGTALALGRSLAEAGLGLVIAAIIPAVTVASLPLVWRRSGPQEIAGGDAVHGRWLSRLTPAISVPAVGLRAALARPVRSASAIATLAVAAAAVAIGVVLVVRALIDAGPTDLAASVTAALRPLQLSIVAVTGLAAVLLTVGQLRADRDERGRDDRILRACGWGPREQHRSRLTQLLVIGVLAAVAAAGLAWLGATVLLTTSPVLPVAVAAVAAISVAGWGPPLMARRGSTRTGAL